MKTCNKCGKRDLSWNKTWYDHSGKWQLVNHKNKDDKWCVNNSLKPKEPKGTKGSTLNYDDRVQRLARKKDTGKMTSPKGLNLDAKVQF